MKPLLLSTYISLHFFSFKPLGNDLIACNVICGEKKSRGKIMRPKKRNIKTTPCRNGNRYGATKIYGTSQSFTSSAHNVLKQKKNTHHPYKTESRLRVQLPPKKKRKEEFKQQILIIFFLLVFII